jgi:hypothetical protein
MANTCILPIAPKSNLETVAMVDQKKMAMPA